MADAIEANLGKTPTQLSADAGDCSDANLAASEERGLDAAIAPGRAARSGRRRRQPARRRHARKKSRPAVTPAPIA